MTARLPAHPHVDDRTEPSVASRRELRARNPRGGVGAAVAALAPLVESAARLDPGDTEAADRLRAEAHRLTSRLAVSGQLPPHLVVRVDDPAVAVIRTLAGAPRAVAAAVHPTGWAGSGRRAG